MPPSTPLARNKTSALTRVLDCVPRGYCRYAFGTVAADKAVRLARKFHALYGIGCTPAQRVTRKARGIANAVLVLYWPESAAQVEWLLLATEGTGLEPESKNLHLVTERRRLNWLGYELVRYATRGRTAWTWRRPASEVADLYSLLGHQARTNRCDAVAQTLARIARQPGFHGVREQSKKLFHYAKQHGYSGELPFLFHVQKMSHGERLQL